MISVSVGPGGPCPHETAGKSIQLAIRRKKTRMERDRIHVAPRTGFHVSDLMRSDETVPLMMHLPRCNVTRAHVQIGAIDIENRYQNTTYNSSSGHGPVAG